MRNSIDNPHHLRRQQRDRLSAHHRGLPAPAASSIWCMHPRVRSTAPTPTCRSPSIRMSIIRSACMRRPRRPMSSWRIAIPPCTGCRPRVCASLPSMGPGAGRTWHCSCSPPTSSPASRSTCSTTAGTSAISPTSATSRQASSPRWITLRRPIRLGTHDAPNPSTSRAPYRLYNIGNQRPWNCCATSRCSSSAWAARRR